MWHLRYTTEIWSDLVADAVRFLPQRRARLPRIHPRLQVLDVPHRLPSDLVVHL